MSRLRDVTIGSIKTTGTSRLRAQQSPTVSLQEPVVQIPAVETITDFQRIRQIPGIQPYLTIDLIPDLIYLLHLEGIEESIKEIYPISQSGPDIADPTLPDPQVVVNQQRRANIRKAFQIGGIDNAVIEMTFPDQDPTPDEITSTIAYRANLTELIYSRGSQQLAALVTSSDLNNPSSIIFRHRSQDIHRSTELVQIELVKNEPDVQERTTIQCTCGSGKVRTTSVQNRSADEPPTIYAQCVICKSKWKMSAA